MTNSSFGKGMALGLILALAIALGIVAYPELSKKKDSVEQQTPVTTIATTETEEEETPVASLTGAIGPEKHQWDYYYDYPSKTISIVDQFVGGSDGWGDGYAMHYAGAIDGLCWSTAIKEHPLLAMTFNCNEGFYDDFLLAYHPAILSGEIDHIIITGTGEIYGTDTSTHPYSNQQDYRFTVENKRLVNYVVNAEDYSETISYEYDSIGRIIKVNDSTKWSEDALTINTTLSYPDNSTIIMESEFGGARKWIAILDDNQQISSLKFGESNAEDAEPDKLVLEDIILSYDAEGYLISSRGPQESGIHASTTTLTYNADHALTAFIDSKEEDDTYGSFRYYYSHKTPEIEKPTTIDTTADSNYRLEETEDGYWSLFKNGEPDYTFIGIVINEKGKWFVSEGGVNFYYNGYITVDGIMYEVKNGRVEKMQ